LRAERADFEREYERGYELGYERARRESLEEGRVAGYKPEPPIAPAPPASEPPRAAAEPPPSAPREEPARPAPSGFEPVPDRFSSSRRPVPRVETREAQPLVFSTRKDPDIIIVEYSDRLEFYRRKGRGAPEFLASEPKNGM
jgi:hypothetical protein